VRSDILSLSWNAFSRKFFGDKVHFSMENRMLNMLCLVILAVLICFLGINAITGLWQRSILIFFVLVCEMVVYYFSRFRKKFQSALVINGFISYIALAINYYINAGINGPTLFLFFFTLHVLVSATPGRLHPLWLLLHGITITAIMVAEFVRPALIQYTYRDNAARMLDEVAVYVVTILFIYQVTRYLRNHYSEEKLMAEEYQLKLKAFFDSSDHCHVLLNKQGEVMYFNNAASRFITQAYKKELQPGRHVADFVNPAYLPAFTQNCNNALMGKAVQEERLLTYAGLGGIWWHFSFMPVWDSAKKIIGLSFNAADVTAAKEQEENLRLKNESLLKIAHIQTHELWQPVATILGLMNLVKDDPQNTTQYLQLIEAATLELDSKILEIVVQTKGAANKDDDDKAQ
jgi:PAS domain S-box-containing protein